MKIIKKTKQLISNVRAQAFTASCVFYITATEASAGGVKLSSMAKNIDQEASAIMPVVVKIAAAAGFIVATLAVWSWIQASKRNEPKTWQMYGVIGGAALTIMSFILMAVTGSIADTGSTSLQGLGIKH